MYSEETLKILSHPISSPVQPSERIVVRPAQSAYLTLLVVGAIIAVSGASIFLIPRVAGAFWPFATTQAATGGSDSPILHDPSIDLLQAAVNPDPNPSKGTDVLAYTEGSALMPAAGLDGSAAPSSDDTQTASAEAGGSISRYTIQTGDSLSEIAQAHGVSLNTILWANDIKDAKTVKPGMSLIILPVSGIEHVIAKGETLATLAKKYSADASDIASYNGLADSSDLVAGSSIIIPGGELPTSAKTSSPKTSAVSAKKQVETVGTGLAKLKTTAVGVISRSTTGNPYKGGSGAALNGFFVNPVPGALLTQSIHGWNGVDLGAHTGTSIRAAAAGTVIVAKSSGYNGGYGEYVVISHDNGTQTLYAHMSVMGASVGENVSAGQVIGQVGTTGDATGPHLHFEVRGARNPFADCSVMSVCSPE